MKPGICLGGWRLEIRSCRVTPFGGTGWNCSAHRTAKLARVTDRWEFRPCLGRALSGIAAVRVGGSGSLQDAGRCGAGCSALDGYSWKYQNNNNQYGRDHSPPDHHVFILFELRLPPKQLLSQVVLVAVVRYNSDCNLLCYSRIP